MPSVADKLFMPFAIILAALGGIVLALVFAVIMYLRIFICLTGMTIEYFCIRRRPACP
tara:strand:- start:11277 stop:11450 length:174 start_codon:yes stop_codon:yes gene_type:complete